MNQLPSMARRRAMRARSAALREVELTAARIGRATQAAHSTVALGEEDVPLVEAVDSAVAVSAELPLVSEETGLAGDDAWEAWDQSDFAKQIAADAAQAAQDAQTSADGKSRVVRSTSEATAAGSYKEGDQWWQFSGTNIVGLWLHDGAGWVQQVVTSQVIASLDAGKITTGVLAADRIGTNSITTAKLASTAIDGMTITGAVMRTAAAGQRLQLDAMGLRAFNAAGSAVATLLSSGGSLSLSGGLSLHDGANASGLVNQDGIQTSLTALPRAVATRVNGFRHITDSVSTTENLKYGLFAARAGRLEVSANFTDGLSPFRGRVTLGTEQGGAIDLYSQRTPTSPQIEFGIRPIDDQSFFVGCHPMSYMSFAESGIEFRSLVKLQREIQGDSYLNSAGGISAPFSTSAGLVTQRSVAAGGVTNVTVTFPVGRFTVAPRVSVTVLGDARDTTVTVDSVTTASCIVRLGSMSTVARTIGAHWTAIQMTSTSANG